MEETYTTDDSFENRKRGREEFGSIAYPKRANFGAKAGHYLVKILVPPHVAGSIIGKGGAQIKELQSTYDVVIKLSQNNQFYPESNKFAASERIVLITGPLDQIYKVAEFVNNLVRSPPSRGDAESLVNMTDNRRTQMMKIVVTNTTAGMIIGKGGATVKGLNETYDVRIQASQKDDIVMGERVISILGNEKGVNNAMEYIIKEKFRDDASSTSITNLDYSGYFVGATGNVAGMGAISGMGSNASLSYGSYDGGQDMSQVNLIQSILQNQNQQTTSGQQQQTTQAYGSYPSASSPYGAGSGGGNYQQALQQQQQQQPQATHGSSDVLQQQGGSQAEVIARVIQALPSNTLADPSTLANAIMIIQAVTGNSGGANAGMSQMNPRMNIQMQQKQPLKAFTSRPDDIKFKVEIPDSLVGRILGRQGATITEIQNSSGCEVKFSQRGEYVPGTQNRLLFICGQASGCKVAQQLILSKIEGETGDVTTADFVFEQIPIN